MICPNTVYDMLNAIHDLPNTVYDMLNEIHDLPNTVYDMLNAIFDLLKTNHITTCTPRIKMNV